MISEGFGYRWSNAIRYDDLPQRKIFTIKCPHTDEDESAFRFHASVQIDANDLTQRLASFLSVCADVLNDVQEEIPQAEP